MTASRTLDRALALVLIALLAAIGVLLLTGSPSRRAAPARSSSGFEGPTMPPGLRAADFALSDQHGGQISLSRYRGRVVVLTFIHSRCHDACPLMVEQIKGALNELGADGGHAAAIGVSVAPSEDTAASRRRFLSAHGMDGRLAFLSGPVAELKHVWHAYAIQPGSAPGAHSAFVLLIDKRGTERIGFPADQLTPEALAHDIRVLSRERA